MTRLPAEGFERRVSFQRLKRQYFGVNPHGHKTELRIRACYRRHTTQ